MNTFYRTVDSLYGFVIFSTKWCFSILDKIPEGIDEKIEDEVEELTEAVLSVEKDESTFKSIDTVMAKRDGIVYSESDTVAYVETIQAPVFKNPTMEFDGVIDTLTYGSVITITGMKGRFAHIFADSYDGWILRDDISDQASEVYPVFVVGEENTIDDPNTIRLRAFINDEFGGGRIEYALQAGEYILYRLMRRGVHVAWPSERPRVPGRWHIILKGVTGVHVIVVPKTGSIMEYVMEQGIGHLAYVESVAPDGTIHVSEANHPNDGIYNERHLSREEWLSYRPVFIEFF